MKSRTSFFNIAVLRKNLTRFAPVWVLYAVAEVLGLMSIHVDNPGYIAHDLTQIMGLVSIFHAAYAFLVAACLFGDLFDSRLCNGLHAMPMKREGWLLTNLASGLVFALIPAAAGAAFAAVMLKQYFWVGLLWQGTSLLQFLFFFGVAVFSAMCAGKRLGMAAIYGILNFLSMLIFWVADTVLEPLLPSVIISNDWFPLFCPVVSMVGDTYVDFSYDKILGGMFKGFVAENWYYLYVCAGVGVVFAVLGWLLYRKRHLETAGDFISFRPMKAFFLLAYTLAMGALLSSFMGLFLGLESDYIFLAAGVVIGWFTGWMLLERAVKVFNRKVLLGFVAFAAVFALCIGLTKLDPMGIATYIPETSEIENACLDIYAYGSLEDDRDLSSPEDVEQVQQLHRMMLETPKADGDSITAYVSYELKNGLSVHRKYNVPPRTETADNLRAYLSNVRSIFMTNDWEAVKANTEAILIYPHADGKEPVDIADKEVIQALLEAVKADCEAGNLAQHDYLHPDEEYVAVMDILRIHVSSKGDQITRGDDVIVYESCENLNKILKSLDIIS